MAEQFTVFDNVSQLGQTLLEDNLRNNLIEFMNWGLLNIGGFSNVGLNTTGAYGANLSGLRLVDHPNYAKGRVWETFRSNWVWESGINYSTQPIPISGVYINGTFYNTATSGAYSYHLNYPLGYVVFDTPIPASSQVNLEYSYRKVNVQGDNVQWFRELMNNSHRSDFPAYSQFGSGSWNALSINRLQYPTIIIEVAPNTDFIPAAIGGHFYRDQDVLFHIFSEDNSLHTLRDIIKNQENKTIYLFDTDAIIASGRYGLNMDGSLHNGAWTYPQWLNPPPNGFRSTRSYFKKITPSDVYNNEQTNVSTVRVKFQTDFFKGD